MLVKCPECNKQISDKAISCPSCGYPIAAKEPIQIRRPRKNKRPRLPNGFGQITKLSNPNLRKPYRAMTTIGKNENGRPICRLLKPVAYFETYNEAYEALIENNRNPYTMDCNMTMNELFEKWLEEKCKTVSKSRRYGYVSAWKYCKSLHNMRVRDVRSYHIKGCVINNPEEHKPSLCVQDNMKIVFNMMMDYAVEYELTDRNYSRNITYLESYRDKTDARGKHIAFSQEELRILFDNLGKVPDMDMLIIHLYSGWRPSELCNLKIWDVDLDNWTFTGGSKTKAGKGRIVPIHPKIRELVVARYERSKSHGVTTLFDRYITKKYKPYNYQAYSSRFHEIIERFYLNLDHTPHDLRKTFITQAKSCNLDEFSIKYIVGHQIKDLTERVYTERSLEWLSNEMNKLVYD